MAESWARSESAVGKKRAGKRTKPARDQRKKKTPEELALAREAAANDRDEGALYPPDCGFCSVRLIGPKGGTADASGVELAITTPKGLTRQRFCSPGCMAAKAAEREA